MSISLEDRKSRMEFLICKVADKARTYVHQRRVATVLHLDGHDDLANEAESVANLGYISLEDAVGEMESFGGGPMMPTIE